MEEYSDEELLKLWSCIVTDIEYNRQNGIYDDSEYKLKLVGQELTKRKYMLDIDEYDALDYYLQASKLYDSGFYLGQDKFGQDYFIDEELNQEYSLKSGLEIVYETITNNIYEYPTEVQNGLKKVFKRFLDKEI